MPCRAAVLKAKVLQELQALSNKDASALSPGDGYAGLSEETRAFDWL
jgi:hypothetical protein